MTPAVVSLRPGRATARRMASLAAAGRLLRLELKRNVVPYVLPLLAAVFYFDTFRTADGYPPVWTVRASVIGDHMLFEFCAFAGGMAAWAGSRERRRKALNLVASTPRAAWARLSVTLAGTLGWLLLAFLAGVAAIYIPTALQATWGGPPLWPVFAGAAGVIAVTIIGFACGVSFPGGSPRRWSRSACSCSTRPGSARHWASRPRRARTRCCRRPAPCPLSTRASTSTSRRTCRSRRSCSWAGSRSRCSACSPWRRRCVSRHRPAAVGRCAPCWPAVTTGCSARSRSSWSRRASPRRGPLTRSPGPRS